MPKKHPKSSNTLGNALINSRKVQKKAHIKGEGPDRGYKVVSLKMV
jgi:hypothetical protein